MHTGEPHIIVTKVETGTGKPDSMLANVWGQRMGYNPVPGMGIFLSFLEEKVG
jgi:hypothetical protein